MREVDARACPPLVAAMVRQAVRDLRSKSPKVRAEAYAWLTDGGLTWACEWLEDLDAEVFRERLVSAGILEDDGVVVAELEDLGDVVQTTLW